MTGRAVFIVVAAAMIAAACGEDRAADEPPLVTSSPNVDDDTPADGPGASSTAPTTEAASSTTTAPRPAVTADPVTCPGELSRHDEIELACGVVTVPIDRSDGSIGSTRITIATMTGHDTGSETPLAVLQGGPGGSSTDFAAWVPQQPFTQVFIDQRGTGFVGPDFDCPEIDDSLGRILNRGTAASVVLADAAYDDCARRLGRDQVLRHTETESHAADVVDVMDALGHRRWVGYGVSYGSTIGLELLRDEPAGLVGVVLDGVYPPGIDADAALVASASRALDVLDTACALESMCRGHVADGSVRTTFERVMAGLDGDPIVVSLTGDEIGYHDDVDLVLDGRRTAELAFVLMYHESLLRHLPAVIGGLDERDPSAAHWLARTGARLMISSHASIAEGTYFAVQCHDRLPFTDGPGGIDDPFAAAIVSVPLSELCEEWGREPAPASVDDPVGSTLPTLLLSGAFDPVTPPDYATAAAVRLAEAHVVEQDGRGHGIWFGNACIGQLVQLFVADPVRDLDTSCADTPVAVEWARPEGMAGSPP